MRLRGYVLLVLIGCAVVAHGQTTMSTDQRVLTALNGDWFHSDQQALKQV